MKNSTVTITTPQRQLTNSEAIAKFRSAKKVAVDSEFTNHQLINPTIQDLYDKAADQVKLYGHVKYWHISACAIGSDLTDEEIKTVLWDIGSNNTCEVSPTL